MIGSRTQVAALPHQQRVYDSSPPQEEQQLKQSRKETMNYARRLMIGSTAPTCTFNECRGCKFKCRAEQVPVEGNDPINSAYHYRCVCHSCHTQNSEVLLKQRHKNIHEETRNI
ncbi:stomagen, partial [Prunus dulcis]